MNSLFNRSSSSSKAFSMLSSASFISTGAIVSTPLKNVDDAGHGRPWHAVISSSAADPSPAARNPKAESNRFSFVMPRFFPLTL